MMTSKLCIYNEIASLNLHNAKIYSLLEKFKFHKIIPQNPNIQARFRVIQSESKFSNMLYASVTTLEIT